MAKIMLFIDGTWLYSNTPRLAESYGDSNFRVDFGKLPAVLAQEVGQRLGTTEVDVVRTYLFGSFAINYNLLDDEVVQRRREFYDVLKEEYHYEVETYPINFRRRRLRRADRDSADNFEPKEKCVDISLATNMLYLAAMPYAYDIAIAVIGDRDFLPMLQSVRRLGKRIAIASIKNSCAVEFADPFDAARVKDFDIIWIDNILQKLEFKFEKHQLKCESTEHKGNPLVWTTYHPRKGRKFYCEDCQKEFQRQKLEAQQKYVSAQPEEIKDVVTLNEQSLELKLTGKIRKICPDKGFGFIGAAEGNDYFFHFTDLLPGLDFEKIDVGQEVDFEVKTRPSNDKGGSAQRVQKHNDKEVESTLNNAVAYDNTTIELAS